MVDERKVTTHKAEMAEHLNGAAQFLDSFLRGKYITSEKASEMLDYILAETKRNIESCQFATQEEIDAEKHRKEDFIKLIKMQMGLP